MKHLSEDKSILKKEFEVNSFLVNFKGQIGLFATLNALQDTAWDHANYLGFGFDSITKKSLIWALTRQKLVMKKWPKWGSTITVETWLRQNDGYILREFAIYEGQELIGNSTTSWLTLNMETRRPQKFNRGDFDLYRDEKALSYVAQKVPAMTEYQKLLSFDVRNSDIDVNRHVNNTRYAQWILDSIPQKWHKDYLLSEYEVNFLAETHLGDHITIATNHSLESTDKTRWTTFQGIRSSDQKVVFTARLLITEN